MARGKAGGGDVGPPGIAPEQGAQLLQVQIAKGQDLLLKRPLSSDAYGAWELVTRNVLEKAFGRNSPNIGAICDIGKFGSFAMDATEDWWENHRAESLGSQLVSLGGLVELLRTDLRMGSSGTGRTASSTSYRRVFLVHGHDEQALHETARFLERLEQHVVVLREQPNAGRTIIEKFEDYSDVGYAVVLMTPDDRGGLESEPYEAQRPRARQNVIFELGYFVGKLGRNRVCALYREGVELPTDFSGVLFVRFDERGAWRLEVAREIRAAGLPVDMNNAL